MPGPGRFDDALDVPVFGRPAEHLLGEGRIGHQLRRIARAAGSKHVRDLLTAGSRYSAHHVQNGLADAGAQIDGDRFPAPAQIVERENVRPAQIEHVDVVANGGSIGSRIVGPVDFELRTLSLNRFEGGRDQVRFRLVQFPQLAFGIGSGRVEVPRARPI